MARRGSEGDNEDMPFQAASPGQLYKEISTSMDGFAAGETKLTVKPHPPFVKLCKRAHGIMPSLGKGEKFSEKNKAAVDFLGWELTAEEFGATYKLTMYLSFIAALIIGVIVYLSPIAEVFKLFVGPATFLVPFYIFLPLLGVAGYITYYVQNYPLKKAKEEQLRALT